MADVATMTVDELKAARPDLVTALQTETAEAAVDAADVAVQTQITTESAREGSDVHERLAKFEAENAQLKAGALVRAAVQESGLSDLGKELLMERFAGATGPTLEADVAGAVIKLSTLEKALTESRRVPGVPILAESAGGSKIDIMADLRTISGLPQKKDGE